MARKPPKKPPEIGDKLTLGYGRWAKTYKVIGVGPAVVIVRDGQGWTVTLKSPVDKLDLTKVLGNG